MKAEKKSRKAGGGSFEDNRSIEIYSIAVEMGNQKLSPDFINEAVRLALEFEGAYDLMKLWKEESNKDERDEIIADLQDCIDDAKQTEVTHAPYIRFDDLEQISKDIRKFKDSLRLTVEKKGGLKSLAEKTSIPIQSLSRFFNSNSMPRRITLLKIAEALKLNAIQVATEWAR